MTLCAAVHRLLQNINQISNSQNTAIAHYRVSISSIFEKIDPIITSIYCYFIYIYNLGLSTAGFNEVCKQFCCGLFCFGYLSKMGRATKSWSDGYG